MTEQPSLTLIQKKIIKSLLYGSYEIFNLFFARIYTCSKDAEYWLYSGLEGALVYCIDVKAKTCKFLLFDLKTFEITFDCELYKKFDKAYKKGSERFYYFEVNDGFIGLEIPNMNEADILQGSIVSFGDEYVKRKLKEFKPMKDNELKEKAKKMIDKLEAKFKEEEHAPKMLRNEIVLKHGLLEKLINTVELNDETGKIIVKGECNKGIDGDLVKLKGLDLVFENEKKIGDTEVFGKYIAKNILRSFLIDILIPKRRINRGEGVHVEKTQETQEDQIEEEQTPEPAQEKEKGEEEAKVSNNEEKEKEKEKEEKEREKREKKEREQREKEEKEREKREKKEREQKEKEEKERELREKKEREQREKEEKGKQKEANSGVVFLSGPAPSGPPPPPPPPPPPINITAVQHTDSGSSKSKAVDSGPIDLAAELAAKKNKLRHVEVKEYKSSALNKVGEEGSSSASDGGGGMMALIMAKRNAMKKPGGVQPPTTTPPVSKPPIKPPAPKPVEPKPKPVEPKPKPVEKPKPKPAENKPRPKFTPAPGGAKPPMAFGGGGGGFAAMQAMLAGRMAPPKKEDTGPKKPIVELAKGSTCGKMDMSKLIGSLNKNMENAAKKAEQEEVPKVVFIDSGAPSGPPPPPPPPPPPMI